MAKIRATALRLYVNTGPGGTPVYTAIDGEINLDLDFNRDLIDTTDKSSAGFVEHLQGDATVTGSFDSNMEPADTGNEQIMDDVIAGTDVLAQIKTQNAKIISGTIGFSNVKMGADTKGVIKLSGTFQFNGVVSRV